MGLKWYHIILFTLIVVGAAYFAVPTDTQMGVLEARSGRFGKSRDYLFSSIRNNRADWEDIQEYVQQAETFFTPEQSITLLTNYLAQNPTNRMARKTLAESHMKSQQLSAAIEALEQTAQPSVEEQHLLTDLYEMAGRIDDALLILHQMLDGSPEDYARLERIARYQRWRNHYTDEAATLEKMYQMQPGVETLDRLMDIYVWLGLREPALRTAKTVSASTIRQQDLLRKARTVFIGAGDADQALTMAQRVCALNTASYDDFMVWAQLNDWTGKPTQAIQSLKDGLQRFPDNVVLLRFLASLYFKEENFVQAAATMTAVARQTGESDDWLRAAVMTRDAGNPQQALSYMKKVGDSPSATWLLNLLTYELNTNAMITTDGALVAEDGTAINQPSGTPTSIIQDPTDLLVAQARLAAQQGDYPEAEKLFHQYLDLRPEDGWAWYELGELLFQAGRNGMQEMRTALEYLPLDKTAQRYALHAGIRDREGMPGKAQRLYEQAVQADTNAVDVICDYIDFLITRQKLASADKILMQTLHRFPMYLRLERLQALLFIEQGHYSDALSLLRKLYAIHPDNYELEGDLAYAEDLNGHWKNAIRYYQQAAAKSENIPREADRTASFRRRARELRHIYYPQILYTHALRSSNEETVNQDIVAAAFFVTEKLQLRSYAEYQNFEYKASDDSRTESSHLNQLEVRALAHLYDWLKPWVGTLFYHENNQDHVGWSAGVRYSPRSKITTLLRYVQRYPWDDNIFALINDGYFNGWLASAYVREIPRVNIAADYSRQQYTLDDSTTQQDAGTRDEYGVRIEYELIFSPDRTYGIGFLSPRTQYEDSMNLALLPYVSYRHQQHDVPDDFDTVPVTAKSSSYTLGLDYYHPITYAWGIHAGAYVGADPDREIDFGKLYGVRGKIMYILQERIRLWSMYEMISENLSGLDDGETHYWYVGGNYIF